MKENLKCNNIELFPKEVVERFVQTANYVLKSVVFTSWNEKQMKERWRKRSLSDVLQAKEINHLFPCIDTAAIATQFLYERGESPGLVLLTEKGAVKAFRDGKARALHIDAIVEIDYESQPYGLGIGCGDLNFLKENKSANKELEEKVYTTTRHEKGETTWKRTPFLVVNGTDLLKNKKIEILDFILSPFNQIKVPYNLKKEEFHVARTILGKKDFIQTNEEEYNPVASSRDNVEWLKQNKDIFPGLKKYAYK